MSSELAKRIQSSGYTPGRRDVAPLVELLVGAENETLERLCEDALRRADAGRVIHEASLAFERAPAGTQHRLVRLAGKLALASRVPLLLRALGDTASRTRREAIRALGRTDDPSARAALLALEDATLDPSEKRALVEALGKVGGADAEARLAKSDTDDALTARMRTKARLTLDRELSRAEPRAIRMDASIRARARFSCRGGLEKMLAKSLEDAGLGEVKIAALGAVDATFDGPLEKAYRVRIWTEFGFVIDPGSANSDRPIAERVESALTSPACVALVRAASEGSPTFRISLASGTKKRSLVWDIAERVHDRGVLKNDPRESLWTLHVDDRTPRSPLVLSPSGVIDPRFSYRVADVPAASHPTLAAALVHVAGARPNDIVWDPFCGSGLELIERARLGPFRTMLGSDIDPLALEAATMNVDASGEQNIVLELRNALVGPGRSVSLIVTNPPLGRRVVREKGLADMLDEFAAVAAGALSSKGRFVWFSPNPERTRRAALRAGLNMHSALTVDMNGFPCELQRFDRA